MYQSTPPPHSQPQARVRKSEYRKAKPLPELVLDHCTDILEEQLYSQTFSLLSSCLTSGEDSSQIPPPQYFALAGTLLVHPSLTTRTTSAEKHIAADDAFKYLQHVNSLLGPQQSGLDKAFQFASTSTSARGKRIRTRVSDIAADEDGDQSDKIRLPYIDKEALWTNAEDFWSVVGWAFNCSVAHPARWKRWQLWLTLVLDVLEDDLESRLPEATRAYIEYGNTEAVRKKLQDSMLSQYLAPIGEGRNNKRRLMRAVLANGTSKSLAEFPEIWKRETKPPKQKNDGRLNKKQKLDIDNSEFGDYYDHSDDDSPGTSLRPSRFTTAPPTAQPSRAASNDDSELSEEDAGEQLSAPGVETYGGIESLRLRQRILALLTLFSTKNPDAFLDTEDLFDLYTEFLRPLPLSVFQQFVLPAKPWLGPNSYASLNQMILRPLLIATAPQYKENALTQAEFEVYYAQYAANSTGHVDNAKVSLLMEGLLRLLWKSGQLAATEKLRRVVMQGIEARKEKAAFDGRRKVGVNRAVDEEALSAMEYSGERMMVILDM
jgi:hypothetical protein